MKALFSEKSVNSAAEILNDLSGYVERTYYLSHLFSDADLIAAENEKCYNFDNSYTIIGKIKEWGKNMRHCGSSVELSKVENVEKLTVTGGFFCRSRLCPACQKRRSLRVYAQCSQVFDSLQSKGYSFLHVVLTLRNCSAFELVQNIQQLYRGFSRLMKRPEVKGFKGALRCLEVTYSDRLDNFHPHLHCLVAVKNSYFKSRYYVSQDELCRLWKESNYLDYMPSVHIEKADFGSIAEVAKYCVKPLELDGYSQSELLYIYEVLGAALHCRRLLQTYGVIREEFRAFRFDLEADELTGSDKIVVGQYRYNYASHSFEDINDFTF